MRCPTCGSREPRLHPATQAGGEVIRICPDPYHTIAEPDAPAGQRHPDHPAERFRQEYPTASRVIRGIPVGDFRANIPDDEVTITYDDDLEVELCEHWCLHQGRLTERHPVPEFTPPPKSERDELLDDLELRITTGEAALRDFYNTARDIETVNRLAGKMEGLALVRDWLRSYR